MPISNGKYIAPTWANGTAPAINASELNAITQTVEKHDEADLVVEGTSSENPQITLKKKGGTYDGFRVGFEWDGLDFKLFGKTAGGNTFRPKLINVGDPESSYDAANKNYVDTSVASARALVKIALQAIADAFQQNGFSTANGGSLTDNIQDAIDNI